MQQRLNVVFLASAILAATICHADEQALPGDNGKAGVERTNASGFVDRLGRLQTEVVLLKAEAARAQAQLNLEQARAPLDANRRQGVAAITSIYGRDQNLYAVAQFKDGRTQTVRAGDHMSNGYVVKRVSISSVTLVRKGDEIHIDLAPVRPPSLVYGNAGGALDTPPLPDRMYR
ncbi:type IV pilus biogenesis protein PilP [Pandoraea fibrosis]|uniref:Type IV pilus biogenesis protein PilP n=1 Tax=Pandoraea fibrosis TaxID=1891094 RepID=A0A5E4YWN3_9BURK|nr:type IV pilus biogenesis protein PilP [Pandoraea fibrosis]VVE53311.1 hypothetical protein PFI31113_04820 [Pandoraea fibrosis]